jgi:hypothetical protein
MFSVPASDTTTIAIALALTLLSSLTGCADAPPDNTPDTRPDSNARDAGRRDGVYPDETPDDDGDPISEPMAQDCVDQDTARRCADDGSAWETIEFDDGQICSEGDCLDTDCDPGEIIACDSPTSLRICDDLGLSFVVEDCPPEAPNCLEDQCSEMVCIPGTTACEGDSVRDCDEEGLTWSIVSECPFGCDGGACIDPCDAEVNKETYLGCEFYAVDLDTRSYRDDQVFAVTISNHNDVPVPVRVFHGDDEITSITVEPNDLAILDLPRMNVSETQRGFLSYRIETEAPVTAHQFNPLNDSGVDSNDASLLLPVGALGNEYLVLGWPTEMYELPLPGFDPVPLKSFITMVATAEGTTRVEIRASTDFAGGVDVPAIGRGATEVFELQRGEVLSLTTEEIAEADPTGTLISSDETLVVFTGSECAHIPHGVRFCDHIEQQVAPLNTWGHEFIAAKFVARGLEPDVWRVLAAEDDTLLTTTPAIEGVHGVTLNQGEVLEFLTPESFVIEADHPISLAQFMVGADHPLGEAPCPSEGSRDTCSIPLTVECEGDNGLGDPAFLLNVPTEQFRRDYIVLTPANYVRDYLMVLAPNEAIIELDGEALGGTTESLGADWSIVRTEVTDGVHRLLGDRHFGLVVHGFDCAVSYAYPGGTNLVILR